MTTPYPVRRALTKLGELSAHPAAFAMVVLYGVGWFIFERDTFDWHAVATLTVWMMTLFIQRSEQRDTEALHAKLDELLHVHRGARDDLASLDEAEAEEITRHRRAANSESAAETETTG